MSARVRALGLLLGSVVLVLAAPRAALAQVVDIPPPADELGAAENWTYKLMWALAVGAAVLLLATVVGYVAKSREFKANTKRGGTK